MKIRGNTIGTPLKPEKNLVKATDLTPEEQAQARENIGAVASVNGISPDENGNVEIPTGGGTAEGAVLVNQGTDKAGTLLYVGEDGNVTNVMTGEDVEVKYGHGKNIFHHEWANVQWLNGVFFERTDGKNMCSVREKIRVTPNTVYTMSVTGFSNISNAKLYLYEFDENEDFVNENQYVGMTQLYPNSPKSFKVGENTAYITVQLYSPSTAFADIVPTGTMIEAGSMATEYEPYFEGHLLTVKKSADSISDMAYAEHAPSATVRSIAHRGANRYAPQCTAPAYILARKMGFTVAENDLWSTVDGKYVMWHEANLSLLTFVYSIDGKRLLADANGNRYWKYGTNYYTYDESTQSYNIASVDGSTLSLVKGNTITVAEETYAFLRNIDCGAWKNGQYAGTQMLSFEEWIELCKVLGMECYIDCKFTFTEEQAAELVSIVRKKGMLRKCSWLGNNMASIRKADTKARCGLLYAPTASNLVEDGVYDKALKEGGEGSVFWNPRNTEVTAENAELALRHGYGYECWYIIADTLADEVCYAEIERVLKCGCQNLTLDNHTVEQFTMYKYGNAMKN